MSDGNNQSVTYSRALTSYLEKASRAGGALTASVGQLKKSSVPLVLIPVSVLVLPGSAPAATGPPAQSREQGWISSLPLESCTHSPAAAKLGSQGERQAFRAGAKRLSLHRGERWGTSFPGFDHGPCLFYSRCNVAVPALRFQQGCTES